MIKYNININNGKIKINTLGFSVVDFFFLSSSFSFFVFFVLLSFDPLTIATGSVDVESVEFFLVRAAKSFII